MEHGHAGDDGTFGSGGTQAVAARDAAMRNLTVDVAGPAIRRTTAVESLARHGSASVARDCDPSGGRFGPPRVPSPARSGASLTGRLGSMNLGAQPSGYEPHLDNPEHPAASFMVRLYLP